MSNCTHKPRHGDGSPDCRMRTIVSAIIKDIGLVDREVTKALRPGQQADPVLAGEANARALVLDEEYNQLGRQIGKPRSFREVGSSQMCSHEEKCPMPYPWDRGKRGFAGWVSFNRELVGSIVLVVDYYQCSLYLGLVKDCSIGPSYYPHLAFVASGSIDLCDWVEIKLESTSDADAGRLIRSILKYGPTEGANLLEGQVAFNVKPMFSILLDIMILQDEAVEAYGLWNIPDNDDRMDRRVSKARINLLLSPVKQLFVWASNHLPLLERIIRIFADPSRNY